MPCDTTHGCLLQPLIRMTPQETRQAEAGVIHGLAPLSQPAGARLPGGTLRAGSRIACPAACRRTACRRTAVRRKPFARPGWLGRCCRRRNRPRRACRDAGGMGPAGLCGVFDGRAASPYALCRRAMGFKIMNAIIPSAALGWRRFAIVVAVMAVCAGTFASAAQRDDEGAVRRVCHCPRRLRQGRRAQGQAAPAVCPSVLLGSVHSHRRSGVSRRVRGADDSVG